MESLRRRRGFRGRRRSFPRTGKPNGMSQSRHRLAGSYARSLSADTRRGAFRPPAKVRDRSGVSGIGYVVKAEERLGDLEVVPARLLPPYRRGRDTYHATTVPVFAAGTVPRVTVHQRKQRLTEGKAERRSLLRTSVAIVG